MSLKNKELIQMINEAFARGDTERLSDYLAEDARWNIIGISTITGRKNIMKAMEIQELEKFPEITVNHIVAKGDSVVVESTGKAFQKAGGIYSASYCDVYRFKDGKIKEFTTYVIERA
jgi:ketosteroid isomerase-like protein